MNNNNNNNNKIVMFKEMSKLLVSVNHTILAMSVMGVIRCNGCHPTSHLETYTARRHPGAESHCTMVNGDLMREKQSPGIGFRNGRLMTRGGT